MKLLHILNPRTFIMPEFQNFVMKALATNPFIPDAQDAMIELSGQMLNPNIGLFVTVEGDKPPGATDWYRGLVLVVNSTTPLSPGCMVLTFYNRDAGRESRNLLMGAIKAFANAHGHTKIRGMNISGQPDAFAKLFREVGSPTLRGHLFEFELSEGA